MVVGITVARSILVLAKHTPHSAFTERKHHDQTLGPNRLHSDSRARFTRLPSDRSRTARETRSMSPAVGGWEAGEQSVMLIKHVEDPFGRGAEFTLNTSVLTSGGKAWLLL